MYSNEQEEENGITLKEYRSHMAREAVNARWAKTTQKERSEYGKMMAEAKRKKNSQ